MAEPSSRADRYVSTQGYRPRRPPVTVEDRDACALYAAVQKDATPAHEPITTALTALQKMLHRAGNVDGEGDGCGVMVDIPRRIWAEEIRAAGAASHLALDPQFAVGHIFISRKGGNAEETKARAREIMSRFGVRVLAERQDVVNSSALGATAREEEPIFWQVGGLIGEARLCFEITVALEQELDVHVASFSIDTCVYKVMGAPQVLGNYFPDLLDERAETAAIIGHNRYSTNTWPSFKRVQPFSVLGHNGEINTIAKLRQEARMLNVPIHVDGSDSQDLNRTVESLVNRGALSLVEALELVLPPIVNEIKQLPEELRAVLHVPAPGLRAVLTGPGRAARAPQRRDRLLGGRARPAAALAARDLDLLGLLLGAGRRAGAGDGGGAQAARAGREGDDLAEPQEGGGDAAPAHTADVAGLGALAGPHRQGARRTATRR